MQRIMLKANWYGVGILVDMVKEEKERMLKKDLLDKEYPPWPPIEFNLQTIQYFQDVRKLCAEGLDPKSKSIDEYVTHGDKVKLFGNPHKFKSNYADLPSEVSKGLLDLFWRIYGHAHVPNNEYMAWVVKGFIAEKKGHVVNWASAAVTTAAERGKRGTSASQKSALNDAPNRSWVSEGTFQSPGVSNGFTIKHVKVDKSLKTFNQGSDLSQPMISELHVVHECDIHKVDQLLELKQDMWKFAKAKARALEEKKKSLEKNYLRTEANMEDRKDASLEADEMEKLAEKKLAELEIRCLSILQKVFLASLYFLIFFNIPYM